jgi:hypothetical protein
MNGQAGKAAVEEGTCVAGGHKGNCLKTLQLKQWMPGNVNAGGIGIR